MRAVGIGELMARLEALRNLLAAEGLFNEDRKKPLPFLPRRIGLICGQASDAMHDVIDEHIDTGFPISNLFVSQESAQKAHKTFIDKGDVKVSKTLNMKNGYGFVAYPPNNLFFHYLDIHDGDFNEIKDGDTVEFTIEVNDKGNEVAKNVRKVDEELYDFNFEDDESLYNN
jgi:cold shock CspA family protein